MSIPSKLIEFLDQSKSRYEIQHHPEAFTAQELAAIENVKGKFHAKVIIIEAEGEKFMAVLSADHRVDLEKLDKLTGKRASLATEAEFKALFPDCAIGTMPPFGNLYGLKTYVDRGLTGENLIVFEAGTHTDSVKMNYHDYASLAQPIVADLAVKLH